MSSYCILKHMFGSELRSPNGELGTNINEGN